jgi:hypothetical protein
MNKTRYSKSDAVKELESLADSAKRERYPKTPPEWLAPVKFRDDSANGLTRCIVSFLRLQGHQAERISNTGRPVDRTISFTDVMGRRRTVGRFEWVHGTGSRGTADISATIAGQSVKIEVKAGRDRQSDAQRRYQDEVERAGGTYIIARDFTGFLQWYNQNFGNG